METSDEINDVLSETAEDVKTQDDAPKDSVETSNGQTKEAQNKEEIKTDETKIGTSEQDKDQNLEQKILKNVMEKLKTERENFTQEKMFHDLSEKDKGLKNIEFNAKKEVLKQCVSSDLAKIQNFVMQGVINPMQGQNLKNLVIKKAFDKYVEYGAMPQNKAETQPLATDLQGEKTIASGICEFQKENPDFFKKDGRNEVLNYLQLGRMKFDKNELDKISALVETVEKAAIERYLKQTEYQKKLKTSNETAKRKLKANAQDAAFSEALQKTFTRKEIGKMTGAEFTKNEARIMEQLRKGLIK